VTSSDHAGRQSNIEGGVTFTEPVVLGLGRERTKTEIFSKGAGNRYVNKKKKKTNLRVKPKEVRAGPGVEQIPGRCLINLQLGGG